MLLGQSLHLEKLSKRRVTQVRDLEVRLAQTRHEMEQMRRALDEADTVKESMVSRQTKRLTLRERPKIVPEKTERSIGGELHAVTMVDASWEVLPAMLQKFGIDQPPEHFVLAVVCNIDGV